MTISVIIPSYNGAKKLPNILQALSKQSYQDFELIVVLDGSTDNSKEVIESLNLTFKNFKLIDRENGGRAVARNSGAKEAKGDLLIFFDDDTRPKPNSIQLHLEHHKQYPESLLMGNVPEDPQKMKTDVQCYKSKLSMEWVGHFTKTERLTKETFFLTAANFSIAKNVFEKLGGFDERLTDSEDFDLGVQALEKDFPIYFDANNVAWHDDFITMKSYIKRIKQYKKSHEVLKKLKPELYERFNQYEYNEIGLGKRLIYGFFSFGFWVWTVDKFNWLKIIPVKLRYKIYDIIITGKSVYFK